MSTTIAAQQKQDFFEDLSNRADIDEFTSSSILDFLNKERQCNFGTDEAATDIDVESIFEEINRLSDNTDRSVEEILREAELLITNQQQLCVGSNGNSDKKNYIDIGSISSKKKQETVIKTKNNKINDFEKIIDIVEPDSIISDESTPQYMGHFSKTDNNEEVDDDTTDTIEEIVDGIDSTQVTVYTEPDGNINCNKIKNKNDDNKLIDNILPGEKTYLSTSKQDQNNKNSIRSSIKELLLPENVVELSKSKSLPNNTNSQQISENTIKMNRKIVDKTSSSPQICHSLPQKYTTTTSLDLNRTLIPPNTLMQQNNKSTNSMRIPTMVSVQTSPIENISVSREYSLKQEIDLLQEKLKDTEERLQSLRLQHDSLSQIHRDLRENHTHAQEESELLKLDVQHLTECANILRTELQSARNDRNEALDVQKQLQFELDDNKFDKKKMQEQNEKDTKIIQDLQRQCKEMERILMRKHPDSVSALIVASKNPSNRHDDNSVSRRLLEQRIAQLESDAKDQDMKAQKILANVQARFNSVQSKYETHIADLETQVLSLQEINTKLNEKIEFQIVSLNNFTQSNNNFQSSSTQTQDIAEREIKSVAIGTQTDMSRPNSATAKQTPNITLKKSSSSKLGSSHSETTISTYHAAAKEDAHLLATIRGMRVDLAIKDKAMQRLTRELDECKKTIKKLQKEKDVMKSDKPSSFASTSSTRKYYDPAQYCDQQSANDNQALKEALNKIKLLEFDYKALHDKRLQDLKTLQAAHERELSSCHETVRILQQRLSERDEAFANQRRRKVPIDYYALKAKVSSLERRHSEREQRLHMLVEALSKGRLNGALEEILTDDSH